MNEFHVVQIQPANWPGQIGQTLEELAVQFGLKRRFDSDEFPEPSPSKARTTPISSVELRKILQFNDYNGWYIDNFGNADATYISKIFRFSHFNQASEFIRIVSEHIKTLDHHPEWRNVFNQVSVSLTTWDARRKITIYDLNLALIMNKVEERIKTMSRM